MLILWGNPSNPIRTLSRLNAQILLDGASITMIRQTSDSLSLFLPSPPITLHGGLICDDDVETDLKPFEIAFKYWGSRENSIVRLFARSHDLGLSKCDWLYTIHPDKQSIMHTKFVILKAEYLCIYTCRGRHKMIQMRDAVGAEKARE